MFVIGKEKVMHGEAILIDPRIVKGVFLFGLLLGMLGSLFLAYDLLGSKDGPIRKFLRLSLPGLLGALAIVPVYLLGLLGLSIAVGLLVPGAPPVPLDLVQLLVVIPSVGVFLGVMTALYGAPVGDNAVQPTFSRRDSRSGFLLALVFIATIDAIQFARHPYMGLQPRHYWIMELSSVVAAAIAVGAVAGLWRAASRITIADAMPARFAPHEAVVSASAGGAMVLVPNLVSAAAVTLLMPHLQVPSAFMLALVVASAGAVIGGLWPRVFWWANHTSEHRLELIGVLCILAGFVAQSLDPIVGLLGH
jgi:hypothetical protein